MVARPDEKWGETPLRLRHAEAGRGSRSRPRTSSPGAASISRIQVPADVVFGPLPKTSTGKIQKFVLRERALSA